MDTKRIEQLLEKLEHPKNEHVQKRMPRWLEESTGYVVRMREHGNTEPDETLRMRYICNHMCSNLVHLRSKPLVPGSGYREAHSDWLAEYQELSFQYTYENTQVEIVDEDGTVKMPGVHHTAEELSLVEDYVRKIEKEKMAARMVGYGNVGQLIEDAAIVCDGMNNDRAAVGGNEELAI